MFPLVVFVSIYLGAYSLIVSCIFCICLIPIYFVLAGLPAWLLNLNTYLHFYQKKKYYKSQNYSGFFQEVVREDSYYFSSKTFFAKIGGV